MNNKEPPIKKIKKIKNINNYSINVIQTTVVNPKDISCHLNDNSRRIIVKKQEIQF